MDLWSPVCHAIQQSPQDPLLQTGEAGLPNKGQTKKTSTGCRWNFNEACLIATVCNKRRIEFQCPSTSILTMAWSAIVLASKAQTACLSLFGLFVCWMQRMVRGRACQRLFATGTI